MAQVCLFLTLERLYMLLVVRRMEAIGQQGTEESSETAEKDMGFPGPHVFFSSFGIFCSLSCDREILPVAINSR